MRWHHGHSTAVHRPLCKIRIMAHSPKRQTPIAICIILWCIHIGYKVNQILVKNGTCKNKNTNIIFIYRKHRHNRMSSEYLRHVWHRVERAYMVRWTKSITHYTRLFSLYLYIILYYILCFLNTVHVPNSETFKTIYRSTLSQTRTYIYIYI